MRRWLQISYILPLSIFSGQSSWCNKLSLYTKVALKEEVSKSPPALFLRQGRPVKNRPLDSSYADSAKKSKVRQLKDEIGKWWIPRITSSLPEVKVSLVPSLPLAKNCWQSFAQWRIAPINSLNPVLYEIATHHLGNCCVNLVKSLRLIISL